MQSLAAAAAFFYTTQLSLTIQLVILIISNTFAALCFFSVEHMTSRPAPPGGTYKKLSENSDTDATASDVGADEKQDD